MTARVLAFELSQLAPAQREQLLAELPVERREQMEALLQEIAGLLSAPAGSSFDKHLAIAAAAPEPQPLRGLNDGQLRLLLSAEPASVQKRLSAVVRSGQMAELAPTVATVVTEYLLRKVQASEIRGAEQRQSTPWWWRWTRASR